MNTQNLTTRNHQFTTANGNHVEVFRVSENRTNGTFRGRGQTVRTFALVNNEHEVEVQAGCSFMATLAVREAGF